MLGYLEEGRSRFTKVTQEYDEEFNRDNAEKKPIDSEKKAIKKGLNAKNIWKLFSVDQGAPGGSDPPIL